MFNLLNSQKPQIIDGMSNEFVLSGYLKKKKNLDWMQSHENFPTISHLVSFRNVIKTMFCLTTNFQPKRIHNVI